MPARDYASTRFSPLDQINASNVGKLQAAWMFSVGTQHGQEAAPLIVGDTLYVVSSYPNKVFALDSTTGDLKWTYIPNQNRAAQGVACCDVVTRGIAYDNGKIFPGDARQSRRRARREDRQGAVGDQDRARSTSAKRRPPRRLS